VLSHVSRLVPYKRIDLIISAFTQLRLPLIVIGDGPDADMLRGLGADNVQFVGEQPDSVVEDYMGRCKAFVFAAEEDFGITPVEAQAAGAPVIGCGRGGILDSVIHGKTGVLYKRQCVPDLVSAVRSFENAEHDMPVPAIRKNAERFAPEHFLRQFSCLLEKMWGRFGA
jgi:glycosyltransferase involved in cell wall biosynthesis